MLVPGTGDEVQALKAGIMEIADIFVVNKADREGADRTAASIEAMLALQPCADGTMAAAGPEDRGDDRRRASPTGRRSIERFREHGAGAAGRRRRARAEWRLREICAARFCSTSKRRARAGRARSSWLDRIADRARSIRTRRRAQ